MPHAIIEYSANINFEENFTSISQIVHDVLSKSGLFILSDIKTRSYSCNDFLVGDKNADGSFVHVTIKLLEGRTFQQKQKLSEALINALKEPLKNVDQLSIDICDMDRETYRKNAKL